MAKCCVVFSQSPFEDLTAFRVRHVLLLVSILTSNAPGQWTLEYATTIWGPYHICVIDSLEQVQRSAVCFTTGDYQSTSSVTAMLAEIVWKRLEDLWKDLRLALLYKIYKIVHGHVTVPLVALNLEPPDPRTNKNHNHANKHLTPHTDPYKYFFLCRTIPEWNSLPASADEATSIESFKTHLAGRPKKDQPWSVTPTHPRQTSEEDCRSFYHTRPVTFYATVQPTAHIAVVI